jgi:hypothetical protein
MFILLMCSFYSCETKPSKTVSPHLYYYSNSPAAGPLDTLNYRRFNVLHPSATLQTRDTFLLDYVEHEIKVYSLNFPGPLSINVTYYLLDSLGVIYFKEPASNACGFLHSDNDSINRLISRTFAEILSEDKLRKF